MRLASNDFLHSESAKQVSEKLDSGGNVTLEPIKREHFPSVQEIIASGEFKAQLAQRVQEAGQTPVFLLSPEVQNVLAKWNSENPLALGSILTAGSFAFAQFDGVQSPPTNPVVDPAAQQKLMPTKTPPSGTGSYLGASSTGVVHALTAQQLGKALAPSSEFNIGGAFIGANAGAAAGLGMALIAHAVRSVSPSAGAGLDLGCILLGAVMGGVVGEGSRTLKLTYNVKDQVFGAELATSN